MESQFVQNKERHKRYYIKQIVKGLKLKFYTRRPSGITSRNFYVETFESLLPSKSPKGSELLKLSADELVFIIGVGFMRFIPLLESEVPKSSKESMPPPTLPVKVGAGAAKSLKLPKEGAVEGATAAPKSLKKSAVSSGFFVSGCLADKLTLSELPRFELEAAPKSSKMLSASATWPPIG